MPITKSQVVYAVPSRYPITVAFFGALFIAAKMRVLDVSEPTALVGLKLIPLGVVFILADKLATQAAESSRFSTGILAGIGLSSLGDLLLELEGHVSASSAITPEVCFLGGLGSFLLAHVAYVWAFGGQAATQGGISGLAAAVVCYGYALAFVAFLWKHIDDAFLRVAVIAYAMAIASMLYAALYWRGTPKATAGSVSMAIGGALMFVVSDSVLGYDRFVAAGPRTKQTELAVMATYYAAQYLIALSLNGIKTDGALPKGKKSK